MRVNIDSKIDMREFMAIIIYMNFTYILIQELNHLTEISVFWIIIYTCMFALSVLQIIKFRDDIKKIKTSSDIREQVLIVSDMATASIYSVTYLYILLLHGDLLITTFQ